MMAAAELAHDLGLLRVAEVHVVGDGQRPRADGVMLRHASATAWRPPVSGWACT